MSKRGFNYYSATICGIVVGGCGGTMFHYRNQTNKYKYGIDIVDVMIPWVEREIKYARSIRWEGREPKACKIYYELRKKELEKWNKLSFVGKLFTDPPVIKQCMTEKNEVLRLGEF